MSCFFFNDAATTQIYTLSLHDALPIYNLRISGTVSMTRSFPSACAAAALTRSSSSRSRSEEHTSELQSLTNLVCRLLLEKKKDKVRTAARPKKSCKRRHERLQEVRQHL